MRAASVDDPPPRCQRDNIFSEDAYGNVTLFLSRLSLKGLPTPAHASQLSVIARDVFQIETTIQADQIKRQFDGRFEVVITNARVRFQARPVFYALIPQFNGCGFLDPLGGMSHPSVIGSLIGLGAKMSEHEVVERAWAILDKLGVSARVCVSSIRVARFNIAPGHVVRVRAMQLHGARGEALLVREQLLKHQQT